MRDYWSCSKFADWVRGTDYPEYASSDEWRNVKHEAKDLHPVRFWIADTALDSIQDFIRWPIDFLHSIKYWICNRYVTKTHALTANSNNIKPGSWAELDTRMFHCLFDELVNFVEYELAWNFVVWDENNRAKYVAPFTACGWFRTRTWRCPEAGIEYLEWASSLTYNEDMGCSEGMSYLQPTSQAIGAKETLYLYKWYTEVYPNRPDPYEESGYNDYYRDIDDYNNISEWMNGDEKDDSNRTDRYAALDKTHDIEQQYFDEDTEMMCRLIKIRAYLWT